MSTHPDLPSPADEKKILRELFASTNGRGWIRTSHWESSSPLSTWEGTMLNHKGSLSKLSLAQNNLSGKTISSYSPATWRLQPSDVAGIICRSLTGKIPSCLGRLTDLSHLDLSNNRLIGKIGSIACCWFNQLSLMVLWPLQDNIPLSTTLQGIDESNLKPVVNICINYLIFLAHPSWHAF